MDAIAYHMLAFLGCMLTTDLRAADDMEESEYSDFLGILCSLVHLVVCIRHQAEKQLFFTLKMES